MKLTYYTSNSGHTFNHDPEACPDCRFTDDRFSESSCSECGHTCTGSASTYYHAPDGRNWRSDWAVCDRCRVARLAYSGTSVFPYDVTGPGADLSTYRLD